MHIDGERHGAPWYAFAYALLLFVAVSGLAGLGAVLIFGGSAIAELVSGRRSNDTLALYGQLVAAVSIIALCVTIGWCTKLSGRSWYFVVLSTCAPVAIVAWGLLYYGKVVFAGA